MFFLLALTEPFFGRGQASQVLLSNGVSGFTDPVARPSGGFGFSVDFGDLLYSPTLRRFRLSDLLLAAKRPKATGRRSPLPKVLRFLLLWKAKSPASAAFAGLPRVGVGLRVAVSLLGMWDFLPRFQIVRSHCWHLEAPDFLLCRYGLTRLCVCKVFAPILCIPCLLWLLVPKSRRLLGFRLQGIGRNQNSELGTLEPWFRFSKLGSVVYGSSKVSLLHLWQKKQQKTSTFCCFAKLGR